MKCKFETDKHGDLKRCLGTKEIDPCCGYNKCKFYKPDYMTNADRIRSMNDDELTKFLWGV